MGHQVWWRPKHRILLDLRQRDRRQEERAEVPPCSGRRGLPRPDLSQAAQGEEEPYEEGRRHRQGQGAQGSAHQEEEEGRVNKRSGDLTERAARRKPGSQGVTVCYKLMLLWRSGPGLL